MFTKKVLAQVNKGHLSLSLGKQEGTVLIYIAFIELLHSLGHSLDKYSIKLEK